MGKCAIVTGAASGIGKAIAEALSAAGHRVIVADLNEAAGSALAAAIGGDFVHTDLAERGDCRRLVDEAVRIAGGVHIVVNNAGFQHVSPIESFPEDVWERMLSVMLTAPFLLTRYAWPYLKAQGWGRVVNIASIHALVASANKVAYIAAKHGLLGLTRTAALEGGPHGITVNAICPAYVRTPLVEDQIAAQAQSHGIPAEDVVDTILLKSAAVKRLIEPVEVAHLVCYLCSDSAAAVTGAGWTMDCGWTAQ
jgi:3-hydroxybutyrate dehydrogenase